jgi:PHD/YefM family antitoxin component YafN of YafNO toxin-antitoxin module
MALQKKRVVIDRKGRKTDVVLSLREYRRLLEDIHDLAAIAERRSEKAISLEEMERRLKRDGLL